MDSVAAHVRSVIEDPAVEVRPTGRARKDPSPVSDVDGAAFEVLHRSIREVFPETLVIPMLTLGGTDARHYVGISDQAYRFVPLLITPENRDSIHGTNERITVRNYVEIVQFYAQIIRNAAGP
jgi:carboxypeptidase PM20D1